MATCVPDHSAKRYGLLARPRWRSDAVEDSGPTIAERSFNEDRRPHGYEGREHDADSLVDVQGAIPRVMPSKLDTSLD